MKIKTIAIALALTVPTAALPAQAQDQQAPAAAHYQVDKTLVGTILDDPAAAEILKKMIPGVYANEMFHSQGRGLTLKAIQQFEPVELSDENLAKIQAEFDKIPAKG